MKGFQVTEETLPIVKYYHQHRLLKHTHQHQQQRQQQQHQHQHQQQLDDNDDDDDEHNDKDKGKGKNKGRSHHRVKTASLPAGGKNKEKFYYTPYLSDQV